MNFFSSHPGLVYITITVIQLLVMMVIAGALVSIAYSLNKNNKEKK